jgi:FkbM family methyltransferase
METAMTFSLSTIGYYLRSIPTLLLGVRPLGAMLATFAGSTTPLQITLHDGLRFNVRGRMDIWIIKETCLDRDYERVGVPIQDGWQIVDIGAGLGDFTIYAARRSPRGRVIAYEPFEESFTLLGRNIALNGVGNVTAYPLAVASAHGELHLGVETGVAVKHSTAAPGAQALIVQAITLADILADNALTAIDLLKIDTEGGEFDILLHAAPNVLGRVRRIALEYHNGLTAHHHSELVTHLQAHGFTVRHEPNPVHPENGLLYAEQL